MEMPPDSMCRLLTRPLMYSTYCCGAGPVEAQVVADVLEPLRGAPGLRTVRQGRVVRTVEEQREHHHRHGDEDEHSGDETTNDVSEHLAWAPV
jgi:hypothetical protein